MLSLNEEGNAMAEGTFATAINCMDGRVQLPVIQHVRETRGVDYVDIVTEPGPDGILGEKRDKPLIESIRRRVEISVEKHGSRYIAIVAHHDCAGNPVDAKAHLDQAERAVDLVQSWGFQCEVVPLWVDEDWKVHVIDDALKAVVRG
jgi:hypothetical protein